MYNKKRPQRLAGAVLLSLIATSAAAQGGPTSSGLPWVSGVNRPASGFGEWRGSPLDLRTVYFGKRSWDHTRASANARPNAPRMAIGFPMLPNPNAGQLEACAAGAFDGQMLAIRDKMLGNGWRGSYIRLGWEANRVTRSRFNWAAEGDGSSYVGCFRRWVGIFNPGGTKNFQFVWNMANEGTFPYSIDKLYPGNGYVDVVGSNFYDRCPPMTTDAQFNARVNARDKWGNPAGPQAWINWARARGKKWALPEWGVGGSTTICRRPGLDNPFFVKKTHEFLRANAGSVAFESYFNGSEPSGSYVLYPPNRNPKAAAVYQQLW